MNALFASDTCQYLRLLVMPIERDEDRHGQADHFLGGVAKDMFGGLVLACKYAIESFGDDRIVAVFEMDHRTCSALTGKEVTGDAIVALTWSLKARRR